MDVVRWLITRFGLSKEDIFSHKGAPFASVCAHGDLELAKLIVNKFQLREQDIFCNKFLALQSCCSSGSMAVAQWLTDTWILRFWNSKPICIYAA